VTSASSAQLSEKLVLDSLNLTYDAGGAVKALVMRLKQKQALNKFLDPSRRTGFDATQAGAVVDSYMWDQGIVDVVIDRWYPVDEIAFCDTEHLGFGPLRGQAIAHEVLPKLSRLLQRGEVTGEYTAEIKSQTAHARLTTLATTIV